jgi:hypothetical protein
MATREYAGHMARTQTLVQLTDDLVAQLDAEAKRQGRSRSALVRCVLAEYLRSRSEQAEVARYVQSYRDRPQADPEDPATVTGAATQAGVATMQRLDAEEEAAGLEW